MLSTCVLSDNILEGIRYEEDGLISRLLTKTGILKIFQETISNITANKCKEYSQIDFNNILIDLENSKIYMKCGDRVETYPIDDESVYRMVEHFKNLISNFATKLSELSQTNLGREILRACIRKIELVREKLFLRELSHVKLEITNIVIPKDRFVISDLLSAKIEVKIEVKASFNIDPRAVNVELVRELLTSAISGYVIELAELTYKQVIIS